MGGVVHTSLPPLVSVQQPALYPISCFWLTSGGHVGSVRTMTRLGQTKCHPELALQPQRNKLLLLLLIAKVHKHNDIREVSDHRMFCLQIVEQAKSLRCEVFSDDGHPEVAAPAVRAVLAAILFRQR